MKAVCIWALASFVTIRRAIGLCLAILLFIGGVVFLFAGESSAHQYFNSSEPGCDGSDPNVLWCDDFEDGSWFVTTADKNNPLNDGWNGTPFGGPDPQGTNFGRCSGKGVAGTNCAVTSGPHGGIGQALAMGDHDLNGLVGVDEIYFRYYVQPQPGYLFGQEKALTFNQCCAGIGGIYFGTIFFGSGASVSSIRPHFYAIKQGVNLSMNLGTDLFMSGGNWYYIELHLKLNTPGSSNGIFELWMDDCGPNGLGCTGPGTLRTRYTNVLFRNAGDSTQIGSIWLENWANPAPIGEMYYDQLKVSRIRVGPVGVAPGGPPNPPTNLKAQ